WSFKGGANYNDASGTVKNTIAKADQTITFGPLGPVTLGVGPITLGATSNSGLPVTLRVVLGPGVISGKTLRVSGAGSICILATQEGNANYRAARYVMQTVVVNSATPAASKGIALRVLDGNGKS